MKKCSHCQIVKEDSCFHKNRSTKDGLQHLCKVCHREADKSWYKKHPETVSAIVKRRRKSKKFMKRNPAYMRDYMKRYYDSHRDYWKAARVKRRSSIKGNGGSFTGEEWRALCDKYGNVCLCCGKKVTLVADHVIPLAKGGSGKIENIQPLCQPCNRKKHAQTIDYRL